MLYNLKSRYIDLLDCHELASQYAKIRNGGTALSLYMSENQKNPIYLIKVFFEYFGFWGWFTVIDTVALIVMSIVIKIIPDISKYEKVKEYANAGIQIILLLLILAVVIKLISSSSGYPHVIGEFLDATMIRWLAEFLHNETSIGTLEKIDDLISVLEYRKGLVEKYRNNRIGIDVVLITGILTALRMSGIVKLTDSYDEKETVIIAMMICLATFFITGIRNAIYAYEWSEQDEYLLQGLKFVKLNHVVLGFM